jgi:hypothetical protein
MNLSALLACTNVRIRSDMYIVHTCVEKHVLYFGYTAAGPPFETRFFLPLIWKISLPGVDAMILKIFSPKQSHNIDFQENRYFGRKVGHHRRK